MDLNKKIYVSNLFYYPLKSGKEIQSKEVEITENGILNDRIFVILDKKTKNFVYIKKNCKVYYIQIIINNNRANIIVLYVNKIFEFDLKSEFDDTCIIEVNIWNMKCNGLILNEEIIKAISDYLGQEILLVFAIDKRKLKDDEKIKKCINVDLEKDKTYFADCSPYLIVSQESLDEVNSKLKLKSESPVKLINFRPNTIISGQGIPFYEDKLHKVQIGNIIFRRIIGCERCKVITFDPDKRKFRVSIEPLETLNEINTDESLGGCVFGQYFCRDILDGSSTKIKVGDEVKLIFI